MKLQRHRAWCDLTLYNDVRSRAKARIESAKESYRFWAWMASRGITEYDGYSVAERKANALRLALNGAKALYHDNICYLSL
jgi:hypothetical protein